MCQKNHHSFFLVHKYFRRQTQTTNLTEEVEDESGVRLPRTLCWIWMSFSPNWTPIALCSKLCVTSPLIRSLTIWVKRNRGASRWCLSRFWEREDLLKRKKEKKERESHFYLMLFVALCVSDCVSCFIRISSRTASIWRQNNEMVSLLSLSLSLSLFLSLSRFIFTYSCRF